MPALKRISMYMQQAGLRLQQEGLRLQQDRESGGCGERQGLASGRDSTFVLRGCGTTAT